MKSIYKLLFLCLALSCACAGSVFAATLDSGSFDGFVSNVTGAGKTTVSFSSTGVPLSSPGVPSATTDGTNKLIVSRTGTLPNPAGNPVGITATAKVGGAVLSAFLAKAYPLAAALTTGVALYDLAKELGYLTTKNADGTVTYQKLDTTVCTVAPCYKYKMSAAHGNYANPLFMSYIETCNAFVEWENIYDTVLYYNNVSVASNICNAYSWFRSNNQRAGALGEYMAQVTVNPSPPVYTPSTEQAFIDSVANKSGWPSTSNLATAVAQADGLTSTKLAIDPDSLTVTGPATSTGTQTQKVNADNTVTTTTTTYNHTYSGPTITTTETSVVSNYNPTTNTTTTTTVNSSSPAPAAPPVIVCGLPDTPPCKIDETGTPSPWPEAKFQPKVDAVKQTADTNRSTISGTADKPFFSGWSVLWSAPPLAACTPYVFPASMNSVSVDPCPVVDGMRTVVGYLWALTAMWLSLGMIRRVL